MIITLISIFNSNFESNSYVPVLSWLRLRHPPGLHSVYYFYAHHQKLRHDGLNQALNMLLGADKTSTIKVKKFRDSQCARIIFIFITYRNSYLFLVFVPIHESAPQWTHMESSHLTSNHTDQAFVLNAMCMVLLGLWIGIRDCNI